MAFGRFRVFSLLALCMGSSRYQRSVLEITVFVCGAVVMVFEIIGSRLLSPFIGTSTYVWTSLIGVILASLSLGYWYGGRLADRRPDVRLLATMIFIGGGLISVTLLIKDIVLSSIAGFSVGLEIKGLIASLLLFAPASVCLGMVTPFAVRLKMTSVETTGSTVGRLYALSTVGSIVGTFAAGFFLIPTLGSVRTLYTIAGCLILLSFLLVPLAVSRANIAAVIVLIAGITLSEASAVVLREKNGLHDIDTEYSRVQVFNTTDPASGRPIRALATDPYFVQSAAFLDSDDLVLDYGRFYHLIGHFKPDLTQTLIIGGAGYSFPREYLRRYPGARLDVVEIDPQMTGIAREFFRLQNDPRLTIIHEDGRMYINRGEGRKYDAVLMDAFGSLFTVPTHLTTVEAVSHLNRMLKDDGVVVFNLGAAISGEGSKFLEAELATYRQVFPHVYLFKVNADYPDERMQNLIIAASKAPDPPPFVSADPKMWALFAHYYTPQYPMPMPVLTDDLAPVEYYNSIAQNLYLSQRAHW